MELEPIDPETALELYLAEKESTVADATYTAHKSRLSFFVDWCAEREIENLNNLTGRRLQEYRLWRRNDGNLSKVTEKSAMATLRVFVQWLEAVDAVEQNLHLKVRKPNVTPEENSRDVMLDPEDAKAILAYLDRYEHASLTHVIASLLWHTMVRVGSIRSLDVEDYNAEEQSLQLRHRPETDTPLKNKHRGERLLALSETVCVILDDYIRDRRRDVTDDYGRNPLLTSPYGRIATSTVRSHCYQMTRPCAYGQDCPHARDPDACESTEKNGASSCPSSVSPHPFRRGGITNYLQSDVPKTAVSGRADVTPEVIEIHYDQRSQKEKMEQRRQYLDQVE